MKRVQIDFDDDRAADLLIGAMRTGTSFDFNPIGHVDADGEWVDEYTFKAWTAKPGTNTIWEVS